MYELLTIPAAADGAAEAVGGARLLRARAVTATPAASGRVVTLVADAVALEAVAVGAADDASAGRGRLDLDVHDGRPGDNLGDLHAVGGDAEERGHVAHLVSRAHGHAAAST